MIRPTKALVILRRAESRALGSPPAVIHWIPLISRVMKNASPATKKARVRRALKIWPKLVNGNKLGIVKIRPEEVAVGSGAWAFTDWIKKFIINKFKVLVWLVCDSQRPP